jgi:60 kDa SS-A/Ro ribonucleoprotein
VRAFEAFKKGEGPLPDVPFEMLTALELSKEDWATIARFMSWTQTRMNLSTLLRKGVLEDAAMVVLVAERLRDREAIHRARAFPYQRLAAYRSHP